MNALRHCRTLLIILISTWGTTCLADEAASSAEEGRYLATIAGCIGCHTDSENGGQPFAGGKELKSQFGTFYSPNITPDKETGIGNWSDEEFIRALKLGISPEGEHYYPAFPYTSFTGMTPKDILSIKRFLETLKPVKNSPREHITSWPISDRSMLGLWKRMNFPAQPPARETHYPRDRGAYLVESVLHCGECHTPRYSSGGILHHRHLSGSHLSAQNERVPNITSHKRDGIGGWTPHQIMGFLATGTTPDLRQTKGSMAEVIREITSKLDANDLRAIADYLSRTPPIPSLDSPLPSHRRWWLDPEN
ncbi:MAG: cytochrome c [Sedimenticola sp.]